MKARSTQIYVDVSPPFQGVSLWFTITLVYSCASLLKTIKQGFLKNWPGLTKKLIKKHHDKSGNTTMGHLHMSIQGL